MCSALLLFYFIFFKYVCMCACVCTTRACMRLRFTNYARSWLFWPLPQSPFSSMPCSYPGDIHQCLVPILGFYSHSLHIYSLAYHFDFLVLYGFYINYCVLIGVSSVQRTKRDITSLAAAGN